MAGDRELFELSNGRCIMDEDLSDKMYIIKSYHPERADETSSGFEWSEMGMANLFGMLYNREARYCTEHKSWYTYFVAQGRGCNPCLRENQGLCSLDDTLLWRDYGR